MARRAGRAVRAFVLGAGFGSRLGVLTRRQPKPMMPVVTVPVLEHVLARLEPLAPRSLHVNLHYVPEPIVALLRAARPRFPAVRWTVEPTLTGPAGAMLAFGDELPRDDTFLVLGGDVVCDADLSAFVDAHRRSGAELSVLLTEVDDAARYGVARVDDGSIVAFEEKPEAYRARRGLVSGGIYCVEPSLLPRFRRGEVFDFGAHLIPEMVAAGEHVHGHVTPAYWADVGDPATLHRTNLDTLRGMFVPAAEVPHGIDASARVHTSAAVGDDVVAAEGARVDAGATVVGPAVIGRRCHVGAGAHLERVVLFDGAAVAPGAVFLDGIVAGRPAG